MSNVQLQNNPVCNTVNSIYRYKILKYSHKTHELLFIKLRKAINLVWNKILKTCGTREHFVQPAINFRISK